MSEIFCIFAVEKQKWCERFDKQCADLKNLNTTEAQQTLTLIINFKSNDDGKTDYQVIINFKSNDDGKTDYQEKFIQCFEELLMEGNKIKRLSAMVCFISFMFVRYFMSKGL